MKRNLLLLAFILVFIFLSALAIIEYSNNIKSKDNFIALVTAHNTLYESERVFSILKDIETGTRGYVITSNEAFLEPYNNSKDKLQPGIAGLKKLAGNDSRLQTLSDTLAHLAAMKLAMCENIQQLKRTENASNETVNPLLVRGKVIMDNIHVVITEFQQEENRLLSIHEKVNEKNASLLKKEYLFLLGSAILMLIIVALSLQYLSGLSRRRNDTVSQLNNRISFFGTRINDIMKSIPDPFFALDKKFNFIFNNNAFTQKTDKGSAARLRSENFFEAFPGYADTLIGNNIKQVMETRERTSFEIYDAFANEWQEVVIDPISEGITVILRNINKRKVAELENNKNRSLLEEITQVANIGGWEVNVADGAVTWTNIVRQIHETPSTFIPDLDTSIRYYKQGYSRDTIEQLVNNCIENGMPWDAELQIITAKGNEKWVRTIGRCEMEDGVSVRLVGTFQDITSKKLTDQKLADEKKLLQTIINNLPVNVYVKDLNSRKILVNTYEMNYLGVTDENELLGKDDFDLYPGAHAAISIEEDKKVISTRLPILNRETMSVKSDGSETWFLTSKIALINDKGEVTGIIGISYDITARKIMERDFVK